MIETPRRDPNSEFYDFRSLSPPPAAIPRYSTSPVNDTYSFMPNGYQPDPTRWTISPTRAIPINFVPQSSSPIPMSTQFTTSPVRTRLSTSPIVLSGPMYPGFTPIASPLASLTTSPIASPRAPDNPTFNRAGQYEYAIYTEQGCRPYQEDTSSVLVVNDNLIMFGVYDGHCGRAAADYCKFNLLNNIKKHLDSNNNNIPEAIRAGFHETETYFGDMARQRGMEDGTTVLVCIITGQQIYTAHCGDSRMASARTGYPPVVVMTEDHRPSNPYEHQRVIQAGGNFSQLMGDAVRVVPGMFAFTRSIGDISGKRPNLPVLSAEPEINTYNWDADTKCLILATDGMWDVITPQMCSDIALSCSSTTQIAETLTKESLRIGSKDNVTVMAITRLN